MVAPMTEKEFSKHVNTKFHVDVEAPKPVELELVEVKSYMKKDTPGEQGGMERFSLYFLGPGDAFLQQASYSLNHEKMGSLDIFLVPIGRDERGYRYEAVFNYFRSDK